MREQIRAKLEVKKISDELINSTAGEAADINQNGSEEMMAQVNKNEEAEVFIYVRR